MYDIIVIGAGASGCVAAITAAMQGAKVLLLEQKEKIAKKLYATGNGKCNYTNANMDDSFFYGNHAMLHEVMGQFDVAETISFFRSLGIIPKEKNGYYYPYSEQASSVVAALEKKLKECLVSVVLDTKVVDLCPSNTGFRVITSGKTYEAKGVVVATGLLASPKLGSDGSMLNVLKPLGHRFLPIVPSLCGLITEEKCMKLASGVRVKGSVLVYLDGEPVATDIGELQLADYGISGIPVFQICRVAAMGLKNKQKVTVTLDFLPEYVKTQAMEVLEELYAALGPNVSVVELCNGLLPQKLMQMLAREANLLHEIKREDLPKLLAYIKCFPLTIKEVRDFEFAQVCAGGIVDEQVNVHTLSSTLVEGLYFAGELLNVDGKCGGYNLQWAWSSGYVAGKNAAEWIKGHD